MNIIEYEQILRSGDIGRLPELDRWYWSKVTVIDDEDSCWEYREATRKRPRGNYGAVSMVNPKTGRRGTVNAQRVAFWLVHGHMPEVGRHECDNPPCCRPKHILNGSTADNNRDKVLRGRALGIGGQNALNPDLVRQARTMYRSGVGVPEIARRLGKKLDALQLAVNGVTWGWLMDPPPVAPHERRKSGGKLTQPQVDEIRRLRAEGKGIAELGKRFGVHHSNISIICRDLPRVRAVRKDARFTDEQVREIRRLGAEGEKRAVIGRQFGITEDAVRKIVSRYSYSHVA
jgi:hypothetical protein